LVDTASLTTKGIDVLLQVMLVAGVLAASVIFFMVFLKKKKNP